MSQGHIQSLCIGFCNQLYILDFASNLHDCLPSHKCYHLHFIVILSTTKGFCQSSISLNHSLWPTAAGSLLGPTSKTCKIQLLCYLRHKYNTELDVQLHQYRKFILGLISVDFLKDIYNSFTTDVLQHDGIWSLYDKRVLLEMVILTEVYLKESWGFELLQHTQPGWMFVPCELTQKEWETYENWHHDDR